MISGGPVSGLPISGRPGASASAGKPVGVSQTATALSAGVLFGLAGTSQSAFAALNTVVAAAAPFVTALTPGVDFHRDLANTTAGSPMACIAPAQVSAPVIPTFLTSVQRPQNVQNTSFGSPLVLTAISPFTGLTGSAPDFRAIYSATHQSSFAAFTPGASPFVGSSFSAPSIIRALPDTSQNSYAITYVVPPSPPVVNTPQYSVGLVRTLPDTSQSTPKVLYGDGIPPFVTQLQATPDRLKNVTDTSQSSPVSLLNPVFALPFANAPFSAVATFRTLPDTSQGTAKTLTPDGIPPVINSPQFLSDRVRPVTDTSQSAFAAARTPIQAPIVNTPTITPDRVKQVSDTSQSSAVSLLNPPVATQAPFVNVYQALVDFGKSVSDTSQSAWALTHPTPPKPAIFVGGDSDDKKRKKIHRVEIRKAIERAIEGDVPEVIEVIAPYIKPTEKGSIKVNWAEIYNHLAEIERALQAIQVSAEIEKRIKDELDDEEAILMLL